MLHRMSETLQCLFTVERSKHRENMQEIGRIHGLLLHASGLKSERVINEITSEVTTMVKRHLSCRLILLLGIMFIGHFLS